MQTITVGKDVVFYVGDMQLYQLEPVQVKRAIKQNVPAYLPYILLTFLQLNVTENNTVNTYPIGLVIGPGVTIGNMVVASTANKNLLRELEEYNLWGRTIAPGETVYGLIGLGGTNYGSISLRKIK